MVVHILHRLRNHFFFVDPSLSVLNSSVCTSQSNSSFTNPRRHRPQEEGRGGRVFRGR